MTRNRIAIALATVMVLLAFACTCEATETPAAVATSQPATGADWPQWRGPNRDGVALSSPKLLDAWPEGGPPLLWKSGWIPACEEGGCGSPVVADGKVFVYANAKQPVGGKPYQLVTADFLRDAGWSPDLPDELCKKIEGAWAAPDRPASGLQWWVPEKSRKEGNLDAFLAKKPELDKYIKDFVAGLKPEDAKKYGGYVKRRLCIDGQTKGSGIPGLTWEQLSKLAALRDKTIPTLRQWQAELRKAGISDGFIRHVWPRAFTMSDTIVCLDAGTGSELWRKDFPQDMAALDNYRKTQWWAFGGQANIANWGIGASGTPAIWGGKCYAAGAMGLYCLSAKDGTLLWKVDGEPAHASVLAANGVVYNGANGRAYDAETGALLWKNPLWDDKWRHDDTGKYSSPLSWTTGGKSYIISTDGGLGSYCCLDIGTGQVLWTVKGEISVLTTVCGDILIMRASSGGGGMKAYKMTPAGAELLWSRPYSDGSGDVMYQGHLYVARHVYLCADVKTGDFNWKKTGLKGISDLTWAPLVLADGKIITPMGNSHQLTKNFGDLTYAISMVKATPEKYVELGAFNPHMCMMTSPALAGGKLYLRLLDGVACYDLQEHGVFLAETTASKDTLRFRFGQTGGGLAAKEAVGLERVLIAGGTGPGRPARATIDGESIVVDVKDVAVPFNISYAGGSSLAGRNGLSLPPFGWNETRQLRYRKSVDSAIMLTSDLPLQQDGTWNRPDVFAVAGAKVTRLKLDPQGKNVILTLDKAAKAGDVITVTYPCFQVEQGAPRRETLTFTAVEPQRAAAKFVKTDEATSGTWKGTYGAEGVVIAGDKASMAPKCAVVTPADKEDSIPWAAQPADTRYLQKWGDAKDRSVTLWSAPEQFCIDIEISDGKEHQVALYCLASRNGCEMTVELLDPDTKDILDTQTVKDFVKGKYLVWNLKGQVTVRLSNNVQQEGLAASVGGVFFDGPANCGSMAAVGREIPSRVAADSIAKGEPASRPEGAANWPCFRGPSFGGPAPNPGDVPWPLSLDRHKVFDVAVPAKGASSPIVWGDCIYLTGEGGVVMAFDRATGKLRWNTTLRLPPPRQAGVTTETDDDSPDTGTAPAPASDTAGGAAPTPVTDGKFIYAFFGDGALGCVDSAGKQVWARRLVDGGPKNKFGFAASPMLYGDLLIQLVDRGKDPDAKASFVAAVRTKDGTEAWRQDRPVMSSWTTPLVVRGPAGDVMVTTAPPLVIAYDPKTGRQLWQAEGSSDVELSISPVQCGEGVVAVEASGGLTAFKIAGKGDVTASGVVWTCDEKSPEVASPACCPGRCFLLVGELLTCIDAATGKLKWNLELDGEFWASPVLAKDRLYAINKAGVLFVISIDGRKLGQVDLRRQVLATPAILDGRIYIRTAGHLLCLGQP